MRSCQRIENIENWIFEPSCDLISLLDLVVPLNCQVVFHSTLLTGNWNTKSFANLWNLWNNDLYLLINERIGQNMNSFYRPRKLDRIKPHVIN
jgi:hypothetical protein